VADIVVAAPRGGSGQDRQARCGAVQRLELGLLIHAQHQRRLWRVQVEPHDVADLVDELRVGRQLPVWTRCGLSPKVRQIREMAVWLIPVALAIDRVDQWVSWLGGGSSRVLVITCSTWASAMVRGRPGRGSSDRPSSRLATNRPRHLVTVWGQMPSCSATAWLVAPSALCINLR
jgi:hypothetical protein